MKRTLFVLLAFVFVSMAASAHKIDPTQYGKTIVVSSSSVASVVSGATATMNPGCVNPTTSFMQSFCAASGNGIHSSVRYRSFVEMKATVGNTSYELRGKYLVPPGGYPCRFLKDEIEILATDAKGKPATAKFRIVGMSAQ